MFVSIMDILIYVYIDIFDNYVLDEFIELVGNEYSSPYRNLEISSIIEIPGRLLPIQKEYIHLALQNHHIDDTIQLQCKSGDQNVTK